MWGTLLSPSIEEPHLTGQIHMSDPWSARVLVGNSPRNHLFQNIKKGIYWYWNDRTASKVS